MHIINSETDAKVRLPALLLVVCLLSGWQTARADFDNSYWTPTSPLPGSMTLYDTYWDGTDFIAVGELGTILTSPDGATWTPNKSGVATDLNVITKIGASYIAMGWGGVLLTSPDKSTWTPVITGTNARVRSMAYNGSRLVAVGDNGITLYSDDAGVTWTSNGDVANGMPILDVLWNGSRFIAVGGSGQRAVGIVLSSTNGITWSSQTVGTKLLYSIASAGPASYVAVGDGGTIYRSNDAITWTKAASSPLNQPLPPLSQPLFDVIYDGSKYVAVGGYTDSETSPYKSYGIIAYSTDGSTGDAWTEAATSLSGINNILHSVSYGSGAGTYVAAGAEAILTSTDGAVNWNTESSTLGNSGAGPDFTGIAFDGTKYVGVTNGKVYRSSDGYDWTSLTPINTGQNFIDVTWDATNSRFVALIKSGATYSLYSSATGNDNPWTNKIADVTSVDQLNAVASNGTGTNYVTTAYNGTVYVVKSDGSAINNYPTGTTTNLTGITWNSNTNVFLAVSDDGTVIASTNSNGTSWTNKNATSLGDGTKTLPPGVYMPALYAVAWNGNQYIAVGETNEFVRPSCTLCVPLPVLASVLFSTNGTNWDYHYGPDVNQALHGIVWNNTAKRAVAVGDAGSVIVSNGADLSVYISDNAPGGIGTVGYTQTTSITIKNGSHFVATNVPLVITLQSDVNLYYAAGTTSGTNCASSFPTITCTIDSLDNNSTKNVTISFAPTTVGSVTTLAEINYQPEALPTDNSYSLTTAVQSVADKIQNDSIPSSGRGSLGLPLLIVMALLVRLCGRRQYHRPALN